MTTIRNERGDVAKPIHIKRKTKEYCDQFFTKFGNVDEMDGFFEKTPMIKSDSNRNRKPE